MHTIASSRIAAVILAGGLGLTGCAAVKAANTIRHDVANNRATIAAFSNQLQSSPATPFRAAYVTTGSSPATIVYAVQPPHGLTFTYTASGAATTTEVIVNSRGEFECTTPIKPGSGVRPHCQRLGRQTAKTENQLFDIYTPSHWVTFLRDFSLAAGFAGDQVSSSTKTVNGFTLNCVDFVAGGAGKSTICTTAQGLLGYVKVVGDKTKFEITSYSASPAAALFALPPRARITKLQSTPGSP
jgi:hypothetical protein